MKLFPCGCSLTRESWALCRQHFDAQEGRLDAYWNELERLERAAQAVLEWYDRDGSVGGVVDQMEDLRAALAAATGETE